jgi:MoaA/NifB/PqqE/SkfB family radical SAM enzyme
MLHPKIADIILAASALGLKSNIITNGTLPVEQYMELFCLGLNHIQISAHAIAGDLDTIMEHPSAGRKQADLMVAIKATKMPFRTNTAVQLLNYQHLSEIITYLINAGSFHISILGFLPHYEWRQYAMEVAVHPADLRPYIEAAADLLIESGRLFTIRYHPFCHLSPKYWKYVVNARYVLYDPWEWDYGHYSPDPRAVWSQALSLGDSVAIHGGPCISCQMKLHCGGWNKYYAETFQGAGLEAITTIPGEYKAAIEPGSLHDMNPANAKKGYCFNEEVV